MMKAWGGISGEHSRGCNSACSGAGVQLGALYWPIGIDTAAAIGRMSSMEGAGLQYALPATWHGFKERNLSVELLGALWSSFPARLAGLHRQKGVIGIGFDADFVVRTSLHQCLAESSSRTCTPRFDQLHAVDEAVSHDTAYKLAAISVANITPQQLLVLARCGIPKQWQTLPQRPSSTSTSSHHTQICPCMGESELHSCVDSWCLRKGKGHPCAVAGCLFDVNDGVLKLCCRWKDCKAPLPFCCTVTC